ncbi:MAG: hypothetical protein GOMPHAMPRED_004343 [Gomphillus americanus]|uniref:Uncharacterized protein n=1 Tax=Gomphillus americanus TaxID=1940652 RepID=A0A8H3FLC0_9LECA|nr:MAG: hypothetical protein GOMPHAMPRED_004343 [Gomphillus americanus]
MDTEQFSTHEETTQFRLGKLKSRNLKDLLMGSTAMPELRSKTSLISSTGTVLSDMGTTTKTATVAMSLSNRVSLQCVDEPQANVLKIDNKVKSDVLNNSTLSPI